MNNSSAFFTLIRWKNLLLLILGQFLVKYYLDKFITNPAFNSVSFYLLVLSTVLIAAAGYIINDINDLGVDTINKPKRIVINKEISEKTASNLYLILNSLGLLIGYYVSMRANNENLFTLFLFSAALLYFYSITLKKIFLVGNIAIALLIGLSLLLVAIFDMYEVFQVKTGNQVILHTIFTVVLYYAAFASLLNLIREILKDIEDIEGDKQYNYKTIAVVLGVKATKVIILLLVLLTIGTVGYLAYFHFYANMSILYYSFGLLILFIYLFFRIIEANTKVDFLQTSTLLKLIMLYALFSILWLSSN